MCKNYFSCLEQKTKSCTHFPIFHRFLCSKQLVFMSWNKNKQKILYLCWLSYSLYNISLYFMFSWNAFFCRCRCKASKECFYFLLCSTEYPNKSVWKLLSYSVMNLKWVFRFEIWFYFTSNTSNGNFEVILSIH